MEGEEGADLFVETERVPKPSRERAAMPLVTDRLLVVLREWPLNYAAPVVVPQEAGDHCVIRWRAVADRRMDVRYFGCSAQARLLIGDS